MILFPLILVLSFGLLVMLAGISVLAHFKNKDMGKFHKILSYSTAAFGSLIVFACLVGFTLACFHGPRFGSGKCKTEICYGNGGHLSDHCGPNKCKSKRSCESHKKMRCEKSCDGGPMIEKEVRVEIIEEKDDEAGDE